MTQHLTTDELSDPMRWDGAFPEVHRRTHRYNRIANSVPPEFIGKSGYRQAHHLTAMAFECIHDKYQHLVAVQQLARLDTQNLLQVLSLSALAKRVVGGRGLDPSPLDVTTRAVAAICALVAVITANGGDTVAITTGFNLATTTTNVSSSGSTSSSNSSTNRSQNSTSALTSASAGSVARTWIKDNWSTIRTLPSRSGQLSLNIPDLNCIDQLQLCLQRIMKEHTGLNWRKKKHGVHFELTHLSMWSKLGINVQQYVAWYRSSHAKQFGIVQKSIQCCKECDGAGDGVQCVRQNNLWRCVCSHSVAFNSHRQVYEPLDVQPAWVVKEAAEEEEGKTTESHQGQTYIQLTMADEQEEVEDGKEDEHEQLQVSTVAQSTLLDRLLRHLGFIDGAMLYGRSVSRLELTQAWSNAVVTEEDRIAVLNIYKVDLSSVLSCRTHTHSLLLCMATILNAVGFVLQPIREGPHRHRVYRVHPL
jgi:hypothetical protein